MKTVSEKEVLLPRRTVVQQGFMVLLSLLMITSIAHAAAPDVMNLNSAPSMPPAPAPAAIAPAAIAPVIVVPAATNATTTGIDQTQNNKIMASMGEIKKTFPPLEDKAVANAQNVIKHLDGSSEAVTLDELNTARQAVARLDAMIDLEKHLNELEKMRGERSASPARSMASLIPASALAPSPSSLSPASASTTPINVGENLNEVPLRPIKKERSAGRVEVVRIMGIGGNYAATLKMEDGTMRPCKTGDHLNDHSIVRFISASSVVLDENGETHTLHVRNVDAVFNAMR